MSKYKYINADQFERDCMFDRECEDMQDVIYKLRDYPSADVVEVVRCKDCKYYKTIYESYKSLPDYYPTENDKHNGFCNHPDCLDGKIYEDNFCSKGKRRETE